MASKLVSAALAAAAGGDVVVDAVDGVVTLRGTIPSVAMNDDLQARARGVTGVREVQNLPHLSGDDASMLDTSAAGRSAG